MIEYIIVGLIVGLLFLLGIRSIYRTIKGEKPACACSSAEGCKVMNPRCQSPKSPETPHVGPGTV